MEFYQIVIVLHGIGNIIGVGTATINDFSFIRAIGSEEQGTAYQKNIDFFSALIWIGFALLLVSGLYFMVERPVLWGSAKFNAKHIIVAIMAIDGLLMHFLLRPRLKKLTPDDWGNKSLALKDLAFFGLPLGTVSIVSWYATFFLGVAGRQPWTTAQILISYAALIAVAYVISRIMLANKFK